MQRFLGLFISINCSTCFRRFLRPSSGAQNCTYSVRYCQTNTAGCQQVAVLVWQYLPLYVHYCAPDDGRRNRLKYVQQFIEINRPRKRCILLVALWRETKDSKGEINFKFRTNNTDFLKWTPNFTAPILALLTTGYWNYWLQDIGTTDYRILALLTTGYFLARHQHRYD